MGKRTGDIETSMLSLASEHFLQGQLMGCQKKDAHASQC